jgi:hypothetical protein
MPAQQFFDHGVFAGAARSESIDVVALAPHLNSELDRLDRAILANWCRWILKLADQLKWQIAQVARPVEQGCRKREGSAEEGSAPPGPGALWLLGVSVATKFVCSKVRSAGFPLSR